MLVVGIVGGVASGKSFVASQLEQLGARRLDVDRYGHEVLREKVVKSAIVNRWGMGVLDELGEIKRRSVAERVFAVDGQGELEFLEQLTHPRIAERIEQTIERWEDEGAIPVAVLDAAVLLKAGWGRFCDRILFVDVPRQQRLTRARNRGWNEQQFNAREAAQQSLASKRGRANWVIDNGGSPEETYSQVRAFWRSLDLDTPLSPKTD